MYAIVMIWCIVWIVMQCYSNCKDKEESPPCSFCLWNDGPKGWWVITTKIIFLISTLILAFVILFY